MNKKQEKINIDNVNEVFEFLCHIHEIEKINKEILLNGYFTKDNNMINSVISYEEFDQISLIRYFVYQKDIHNEELYELIKKIENDNILKEINKIIVFVTKDKLIQLFNEIGYIKSSNKSIFLEEIKINDTLQNICIMEKTLKKV